MRGWFSRLTDMKSESEMREIVDLFFRDWSAPMHWFGALWRMLELSDLRSVALPKNDAVNRFYRTAEIVRIHVTWERVSRSLPTPPPVDVPSWMAHIGRLDHIGDLREAERILQSWPNPPVDFASWGRLFFMAWIGQKVDFFEDLARVSRTLAGGHKADLIGPAALELRVLWAAYVLSERLRRDPSRDEVMEECQRQGIRVGHWGKTLKRCKLDFLKGASRGRPRVKKGTRSKK